MSHIYVASPAGRQSSVAGWTTLGLSPSSGPRRSSAARGPLETCPQTCHIKSAPDRSPPFIFISDPSVCLLMDSGFCGLSFSPDASLISRAVRIRAISVEVKCTVLSSAMGMFIFTRRWEEWKQRGGTMNQEQHTKISGRGCWVRSLTRSQLVDYVSMCLCDYRMCFL